MDIVKSLRDSRMPDGAIIGIQWAAAAEIERLRAELEARDGQIAAWLRKETRDNVPIESEWVVEELATAIETGSYRKVEA